LPEPAGPGAAEHEARERLVAVLERIRDTQETRTSFAMAVAAVRDWLADVRVPSPGSPGPRPWSSSAGKLHLSDIEHGGRAGRPVTFVVGLDAGRFPGSGLQDSILPDEDRRALGADVLPTASGRVEERRYRLSSLLAGLRGEVTLSYSAWESAEGRIVAPASILLQAARVEKGDPHLDYGGMHDELGLPVSPVPRSGGLLDDADAWLAALASDSGLRAGREAVLEAYPGLAHGLEADRRRASTTADPYHGVVAPRPDELDPRRRRDLVVSASRAETLGRCPLAYMYRYVLEIRPPDDPELDPSRWLDDRERGSLLHRVFEIVLGTARERGIALDDDAFETLAGDVVADVAARTRGRVPPPSEFVYEREVEDLRADVRAFVAMLREEEPRWIARELDFGFSGSEHPAVDLELPGGGIRIRGRIDRVDRLGAAALRVIDYKTGRDRGRDPDPFEGGRRWQHVLYMQAGTSLLGEPVVRMEYQYPTVRGRNARVPYAAEELESGSVRLDALWETVSRGRFVPTADARDCRYCDFKSVCRVREDAWGNVESPPARWASEHGGSLPEYEELRRARGGDD
ncbi:MAG TPA: PD-(D/E)XK nuclease family protein, partial [Gemmatimonadota bacterium]|nr:PD-(D/E)XK nuclease family protein [Gemmatimonadota bacterium]